jgi:hypothetical protein
MRQQEQKLWDTMKRQAPTDMWLQRVENGLGPGMPDVLAKSLSGCDCWVELKAPQRPVRDTTPVLGKDLRIDQINWHIKAASMGTKSWLLIRDSAGIISFVPGKFVAEAVHWTNTQFTPYHANWQKIWGIINEAR